MRPTSSQTEEDGGSRVADEQTVPPRRAPHEPIRRLASYVVAALWVLGATIAGCGSDKSTAPAATPPAATNQTALPAAALPVAGAAAAAAAPAVPAPAVTQASWAPDALEELLAPIALYPDPLLSQILAASVNAQEVLDAGNWLLQNEKLKGNELDAAAQKAGFGPAMRALVQFPTVVDMMCQQIDWTRQLGSAFTSDQKAVLDAVQRLRTQAQQAGNLKSTPQQTVETKTENNKVIVEVKPADPQIIYVPQYNPQVVYTQAPPPTTATQSSDTVSTGAAVAAGLLAFGVGVMVGNAFHDDYYYPHWGYGSVYFGPRPFYPPAYVYRPVYGPAFRPAYHYVSPPGYRYNYNNINVNRNVNVNVNNNYFNRFNNNNNLRAGNTQSPLGHTQHVGGANAADNWKGRSTYAGSKNPATAERLNQAAGRPAQSRVGGTGGTRNPALADNARASSNLGSQQNRGQHVDRGYGSSTRSAASHDLGATQRPSQNLGGSTAAMPKHDNAFSGARQSGGASFDRAASARGHASAGTRHAAPHGGRRR